MNELKENEMELHLPMNVFILKIIAPEGWEPFSISYFHPEVKIGIRKIENKFTREDLPYDAFGQK